ncbi:MAG TPA: hypothetical protein DDW52_07415 [Planctomycetaceae bacterium]|nr:hypothetical protein [Planctomycetaceae bacterium]
MSLPEFLSLAVQHAIQIGVVAGVVWVITRGINSSSLKGRSHLSHALWAIVLLKCLTPPIVSSPVSPFSWLANQERIGESEQAPESNVVVTSTAQAPALSAIQITYPDSVDPISQVQLADLPGDAPEDAATDGWLLAVAVGWLLGVITWSVYFVVALWRFSRQVAKWGRPASCEVQELTHSLAEKIGVRRHVRVRVVDALIGPAVMGLGSPTIVLPCAIVGSSSLRQLRAVIAHELVHIRRGDLYWSAIQVVASVLWWLHPAAWLASRGLTLESERSCDEETIRRLGMRPAEYARSLIAVLETKQRLLSAPVVPGLRPIDITSQRMERIMRIRHGRHSRVAAFFTTVAAGIIVLPGAAWQTEQEGETTTAAPKSAQVASESTDPVPGKVYPNPVSKTAPGPMPAAPARPWIPTPAGDMGAPKDVIVAEMMIFRVPPDKLEGLGVNLTRKNVKAVFGGTVWSDLGIPGKLILESESGEVVQASSIEVLRAPRCENPILLDADKYWDFAVRVRKQEECEVLSAPKVATLSGNEVSIHVGTEIPYMGIVKKDGEQKIESKKVGLDCKLRPTLSEDRRFVKLSYEFSHSWQKGSVKVSRTEGETKTLFDQPIVTRQMMSASLNLPLNSAIVCASQAYEVDGEKKMTVFAIKVNRQELRPAKEGETTYASPAEAQAAKSQEQPQATEESETESDAPRPWRKKSAEGKSVSNQRKVLPLGPFVLVKEPNGAFAMVLRAGVSFTDGIDFPKQTRVRNTVRTGRNLPKGYEAKPGRLVDHQ